MSKVLKGSKKEDVKKDKVEEVPVVETKVILHSSRYTIKHHILSQKNIHVKNIANG